MAHEQARLTRADPQLGPVGTLVSMTDVTAVYTTTTSANRVAAYSCADCKVRVHAVLPKAVKPGRLRSPSPYFSSSPKRHAPGCTRRPNAAPPPTPTTRTMAGRNHQGDIPAKWNEQLAASAPAPGTRPVDGQGNPMGTSTRGARVTTPGSGTSIPSTGLVERIATHWLRMKPGQTAQQPFEADWNPGGTFATAFVVVGPAELTAHPAAPERVYVGEVLSVRKGASGYILTLLARHGSGREAKVWLQKSLQSAPSGGAQLWARLETGEVVPGMTVFALGAFHFQDIGVDGFYSLPVIDPRRVWLLSQAKARSLMDEADAAGE